VTTQFDPFRFDQHAGPEPVDGPLPSVWLIAEDDDLEMLRPRWHRYFAALVIIIFLGVTALTAMRQMLATPQPHVGTAP
jgi:hypothetical protein